MNNVESTAVIVSIAYSGRDACGDLQQYYSDGQSPLGLLAISSKTALRRRNAAAFCEVPRVCCMQRRITLDRIGSSLTIDTDGVDGDKSNVGDNGQNRVPDMEYEHDRLDE